ncbi:hypothetical protein WJX75_002812 [Coccomyxa subellipsoidea]|uniref:PPM-type phosphatase domain-containing protein n=1 Tax=Coccomyxa subellipsoidea TaxID=248742 RepID=A0ABR2YTA1_9CHLO
MPSSDQSRQKSELAHAVPPSSEGKICKEVREGAHRAVSQSPERKRHKAGEDQKGTPTIGATSSGEPCSPGPPLQNKASKSQHTPQEPNGCTHAGKPRSAVKPIVSFSDELEEDEGTSASFSLAKTTNERFKKEQSSALASPAPAIYTEPSSIQEYSAPAKAAASLGQLAFGVSHARGARPYMEDRHVIIANYQPTGTQGAHDSDGIPRSYAAVFDGHNGSQSAEEACSRMHVLLAAERGFAGCTAADGLRGLSEESAMRHALESAFLAVDREILDRARRERGRDGCCALVAVRIGDSLYTAHAGDSRAVLSRGGQSLRLTEDHKPGLERERKRVLERGGRVEFQRCWRIIAAGTNEHSGHFTGLAISRSLGDLCFKEPRLFVEHTPDVGRVQLLPGDSLVIMASDGLWDVLGDQEAVDTAHEAVEAERQKGVKAHDVLAKAASSALVFKSLKKGSLDNVTVVTMLLRWD